MGRAPCCDKANVKRGPWSPEEDAALKAYIEKNGTGGNWIALPQKIGMHTLPLVMCVNYIFLLEKINLVRVYIYIYYIDIEINNLNIVLKY